MKGRKVKWTYERSYEEAKKYKTGGEFNAGNRSCYEIARRNGWINDYTWLKRNNPHGTWDEDGCREEAKKYKTKTEFMLNSGSAYSKALRKGWLYDYDWFEGNAHWTYESCYEEAKKCNSRQEFCNLNRSAHHRAIKEGWIEDYYWFKKRPVSDKPEYLVYEYRDDTLNAVYIGLTRTSRLEKRDSEHRNGCFKHGIRRYDGLYKYFSEVGVDIPEVSILKDNLYAKEAQYYEDYYVNEYKEKGFNVLNKTKAGSLGGVIRWTEDMCNEVAQKYTSLKEFNDENRSCYETARRNGWLKNYTWLERQALPKNTWTEERCLEAAKNCKTRGEFSKLFRGAYTAAWRNGWLANYDWLEK